MSRLKRTEVRNLAIPVCLSPEGSGSAASFGRGRSKDLEASESLVGYFFFISLELKNAKVVKVHLHATRLVEGRFLAIHFFIPQALTAES